MRTFDSTRIAFTADGTHSGHRFEFIRLKVCKVHKVTLKTLQTL